jgi:hypothetical protein
MDEASDPLSKCYIDRCAEWSACRAALIGNEPHSSKPGPRLSSVCARRKRSRVPPGKFQSLQINGLIVYWGAHASVEQRHAPGRVADLFESAMRALDVREARRVLLKAVAACPDQAVDKTIETGRGGWRTLLMRAAELGFEEAVDLLMDKGAQPDLIDHEGRCALSLAAAGGHVETVQVLLSRGAYPNLADAKGRTPCEWARANGHREVARILGTHEVPVVTSPEVSLDLFQSPTTWVSPRRDCG